MIKSKSNDLVSLTNKSQGEKKRKKHERQGERFSRDLWISRDFKESNYM